MAAASADRPWRCFVAIPIGEELREAVAGTLATLRAAAGTGADGAWRWTEPNGWHVTLAFLGATNPVDVPRLSAGLAAAVGEFDAFALEAGGLGAFPSRSRARVLWYGIADPAGRLRRLARAVAPAIGLEPDARFRGHLTLARAREGFGTDASALLQGAVARGSRLDVDRVILFRSHLGRGPARYEALSTATLRGSNP